MNLTSLLISLLFLGNNPGIPNYFRTFLSARAEQDKSGKDLVLFFSEEKCQSCKEAWNAFTRDASAVQKYLSTQVESDAFDGRILVENYKPGKIPAWVIVSPDGRIIEKWEGGWKDANGQGTVFIKETPLAKPATPSASIPSEKSSTNPSSAKPVSESSSVKEPKSVNAGQSTTSGSLTTQTETFVLQAGYFGSAANADKCLADLRTKGINDFSISTIDQGGKTFYRVWSRSFASETNAQTQLTKFAAMGITTTVKKVSPLTP